MNTTITKLYGVGPGQFFYDPSAWKPVTDVRFGNSGRNSIRGPGIFNTDLSLSRIFPIKERFRLEFRFEMFNATNTPVWAIPVSSLEAPNFGAVTHTANVPRQLQFGLKLYF